MKVVAFALASLALVLAEPPVPSNQYIPSSQYGAPSAPSNQYGPPSGPPSNQYGPPTGPPSNQYGPPSNQYGPPSRPSAPSPQYGAPAQTQAVYGPPNGGYLPPGGGYGGDDQSEPANYQFKYDVQDPPSGNDFGHEEERQGDVARGKYYVLLPDGRRQVVEYTADTEGYKPKISYEQVGGGYQNGGYPSNGNGGYPGGNNGGYQY